MTERRLEVAHNLFSEYGLDAAGACEDCVDAFDRGVAFEEGLKFVNGLKEEKKANKVNSQILTARSASGFPLILRERHTGLPKSE